MSAVEQQSPLPDMDADDNAEVDNHCDVAPRRSEPRLRRVSERHGQEGSNGAVVVVSPVELQTLVRDAVRAELGERTDGDILTRDEAAEMVKVHPKILLKYVRTLGLPAQRLGRDWRFSRRDVLTWMRDRPTASMKVVK